MDSGDQWNPKPEAANRVRSMVAEAHRVLTRTGVFITIAFGQVLIHYSPQIAESLKYSHAHFIEPFSGNFHSRIFGDRSSKRKG